MGKRQSKLTSENLKQTLWETLVAVRNKKLDPMIANSVASSAREIMRVVNTELRIIEMGEASGGKLMKNLLPSGDSK